MKPHLRHFAGPLCFLLIWAVILGVPRLRDRVEWQMAGGQDYAPEWPMPLKNLARQQLHADDQESLNEFAAKYPGDVRVQVRSVVDFGFSGADKLEPLLQRFPREAWLRARYLRLICSHYYFSAAPPVWGQLTTRMKDNLEAEQRQKVLAVCAQGTRLEPDNAFFDLMRALFLYGAGRNAEALEAVRAAAGKSRFDDHLVDETRFLIEVAQLERVVSVENQLLMWRNTYVPHGPRMRDVAYLALNEAELRKRAGNKKSALELRAEVARLGGLMRDSDGFRSMAFMSNSLLRSAWSNNIPLPRRNLQQQNQNAAAQFIADCRALGRNDLVAETQRELSRTQQINALTLARRTALPGVPDESWVRILQLNWLCAAFFLQIAFALPAWLLLGLLLWVKGAPGESARPIGIMMMYGIILLLCVGFSALALSLDAGQGQLSFILFGGIAPAKPSWWASIGLSFAIALAPLVIGALLCGLVSWWQQRKAWRHIYRSNPWAPVKPAACKAIWLVLLSLTSAIIVVSIFAKASGMSASSNFLEFLVNPVAVVLGLFASGNAAIYAILGCVIWWHLSSIYLLPAAARPLAGAALKWHHRVLGCTLIASSLVLLVLLIALGETARPAETAMNAMLRDGEMKMIQRIAGIRDS